jgi:murein DD-endopeptidase MepM/ murein hydrolase activator NlpD
MTFVWLLLLIPSAAREVSVPLADGFDYPVGKPNGDGYYVFRGFTPNGHLGEDWNGKGGGDTDLGDPVYSIASGIVVFSADVRLGWGNCVIVRHAYRDLDGELRQVDSLYGHLDQRSVKKDQLVKKGELLGTIGTAHGMYAAHLHFEIRKDLRVGMHRSAFPRDYSVYFSPRSFMDARRQLAGGKNVTINIDTFVAYPPMDKPKTNSGAPTAQRSDTSREKKLQQLNQLIQKRQNADLQDDEDVDAFFNNLKERLKQKSAR